MAYVTQEGLKNTLNNFIEKLKSWLPIKWNASKVDTLETRNEGEIAFGQYNISNENTVLSIGAGVDAESRKNSLEIQKDGKIFILVDTNNDNIMDEKVNLQTYIETGGTADSLTIQDINEALGIIDENEI